MDISDVRDKINSILWSTHCIERMQSRGITRKEVKDCLLGGEIIEDYPDDFPHPSCLIYGVAAGNKVLHVVVGLSDILTVITVYEPNNKVFLEDLKTRR